MIMNETTIAELNRRAMAFNPAIEPMRMPDGKTGMDGEPLYEDMEYHKQDWRNALSFLIVDVYKSIMMAKALIEADDPRSKAERVAKRVLKITEAIVMIAGFFCSRKLGLFTKLAEMLKGAK
jgi:hypothetical protein